MNNNSLSGYKLVKICECFSLKLTATQTANLLMLNLKTLNRCYHLIREVIWVVQLLEQQLFVGHIELDESYFGGYRKGLKGC
jgi:transposase